MNEFSKIILIIPLLAAATGAHRVLAETVPIVPSKDNTIYEENALSNGKGVYLFAGRTGESGAVNYRRALLHFDLAGQIPEGSAIESAILKLHVSRVPVGDATNPRTFALHRMNSDWGEGASDAPDAEGRGDQAAAGDATWEHRFYPDQAWIVEGGDFEFFASATKDISGVGFYDWSSPGLAADVQQWLDSPESNFGWILIGPSNEQTARRFDSRENPEQSVRPVLTVTYAPPVTYWGDFVVESDGRTVNTGDYLGIVDIDNRPWIYVYALEGWVYLPEDQITQEGGWLYRPRQ